MKKLVALVILTLLLTSCGKKDEKQSIIGLYELKSPGRGSELEIKIDKNNQQSAHINAYYEMGKPGDGMVNICDIEGTLNLLPNGTYALKNDDSELVISASGSTINIAANKLDGCGVGVGDSIVGTYTKSNKK